VTGTRNANRPCSFTVDYDCERRCQAELDLADIHIRFTLGMMLATADRAHVDAHIADPPEKVFRVRDQLVVRASVLGGAS
jgi:hypothetical protein